MRKIIRILVDMDGLLADFDHGACLVHNIKPHDMQAARVPGEWNLIPALAKARSEVMSVEEFEREINRLDEIFWTGLLTLPWFDPLLALVEEFVGDQWHVVTNPTNFVAAYSGKLKWLRARLGRGFTRYVPTAHKEILAFPGAVLIDDNEVTVKNFVAAGGSAILFPTMGNRLHEHANNPVAIVRERLEEMWINDGTKSGASCNMVGAGP